MKKIKIIVCLLVFSSTLLYAKKEKVNIGGTVWTANKALDVEEVFDTVSSQKFYLVTGGDVKAKLAVKGENVHNFNIVIDAAKMIQVIKATGIIGNIFAGTVVKATFTTNASGILCGDVLANLTLNSLGMVKMKGLGVGTVIAKGMKMVMADYIDNFSTDDGFKGKGAKLMTKVTDIGAGSNTWMGVPFTNMCQYPLSLPVFDYVRGRNCLIKLVKAKGKVNVAIYARGITKNGKPKSKIMGKSAGSCCFHTTEGWIIPKHCTNPPWPPIIIDPPIFTNSLTSI